MFHRLKKILKDELIFDTAVVFVGSSIVGVFNLIYQLIAVRLLNTQDYGAFNALISLIMFTSMAISPLGVTMTRFFTEYIARREFDILRSLILKLIKRLSLFGLLLLIFFIISSPYLSRFLRIETRYIFISAGVIVLSFLSPLMSSLFQSFQKFKIYSFMGILSSLGKLLLGAFLMFLGWGISGGLLGYLISPVIILSASFFFIPSIFRKEISAFVGEKKISPVSLVPLGKYFFPAALAMFSFTSLTNIDVVLVKHFFSSLNAGYYSIAQMVGKILLFLPAALAVVIFPKSTASYVTNSHSRKIIYKSLIIAGIICGLGVIFCFLFPHLVLNILTSRSNPVSDSLVGLFALAMSFYALVWIIINYLLAIHNLKFIFPLIIFAFLEAILICFYHPDLLAILRILLLVAILTFITGLIIVRRAKK